MWAGGLLGPGEHLGVPREPGEPLGGAMRAQKAVGGPEEASEWLDSWSLNYWSIAEF